MPVLDRLFGWHVVTLSLYRDAGAAPASIAAAPLSNLLTVFQNAKLHLEENDFEGRATAETWSNPLSISSSWMLDVGGLVDASLPTLIQIRLQYGRGPYWVFLQAYSATGYQLQAYGRVLISQPDLTFGDGAAAQSATLKGVGTLTWGNVPQGGK